MSQGHFQTRPARKTFLPFSPPSIGEEEISEVVDTLRSGWITTGPKVQSFERSFAEMVGAPAALAVNSGTAAMQVALAALGVGPGDSVITTTMTFCSSVHVIEHAGARPILVDVEPDTLNIDPGQVERALAEAGGSVKALLPVHIYGHPSDMEPLVSMASAAGAAILEDAAHSLPASYQGRTIGSPAPGVADLTAFSFYATKNLTTAEGGMLTGSTELVDAARTWALHGMSRDAHARYTSAGSWHYDVLVPGFKCNMTDIQAALGLVQMRRLDEMQARRRQIVEAYDRGFASVEELEPPARRPDVEHAWHLYAIRLNLDMLDIDRAQFIDELKALNIGCSVHFIPVHMHSYYAKRYGFSPEDFPVAYREFLRLISLPIHPRLTDSDVEDVVAAVTTIIQRHRR